MTFDRFMVWSNLCPSCCGNTGRLLHGVRKYEQVSELWPMGLKFFFLFFFCFFLFCFVCLFFLFPHSICACFAVVVVLLLFFCLLFFVVVVVFFTYYYCCHCLSPV